MEIPFPLRGESSAIREVLEKIKRAAATGFPVLLLGETGTGKQAAAEWIHHLSPRRSHRFVEANTSCWNNNTMVHSHLFGHERGAYTGASARHAGVFERADGGTLFLDEIGELGGEVQPMLLKAIDQGMIEPLGAVTPRKVDVRLVAATNRDLEEEVCVGRFRRDLLARIGALQIRLPSLRERMDDLETLWRGLSQRRGIQIPWSERFRERILEGEAQDNLRGLERVAIQAAVWGSPY
jgi:transcriptional regulator with GAF, ATPase, and Fis domain